MKQFCPQMESAINSGFGSDQSNSWSRDGWMVRSFVTFATLPHPSTSLYLGSVSHSSNIKLHDWHLLLPKGVEKGSHFDGCSIFINPLWAVLRGLIAQSVNENASRYKSLAIHQWMTSGANIGVCVRKLKVNTPFVVFVRLPEILHQ